MSGPPSTQSSFYSSAVSPGQTGRHFLQIPGPTNVPDRILRAMDHPTIDHRGPEFQALARQVLAGLRPIFQTRGPVVIYPASGTGAWEAALVNTLSPDDAVLMVETGHFAMLWKRLAERLGLKPEFIAGDWRRGVVLSTKSGRVDVGLDDGSQLRLDPDDVAWTRRQPLAVGDAVVMEETGEADEPYWILRQRPGVELEVCPDAASGLASVRRRRPDLILLDMHLPDADGGTVLARLRAEPQGDSLPIVVVSADATQAQIAAMRERGVSDYLTKPLDLGATLRVVDRALSGVSAREAASQVDRE